MGQLMLQKKPVPYAEKDVQFSRLAFYPENPRIYSRFAGEADRTQEGIQKTLEEMEHVRSLRVQIDRDGQVNEPLYCVEIDHESSLHGEYDYQVLEGNSRLAALKMHKRGALPPASVPCWILDFSGYTERERETLIFSLLGQFHITGKADWNKYENAAYIHRRHKNQGVTIEDIAKEIGKSTRTVRTLVEAFELMIGAEDRQQNHWSYYETLAGNAQLKKHRANIPELEKRVINLIKEDKFQSAQKMRDSLPDILSSRRARRIFLDEEEEDPFGEALAVAEMTGDTNKTLKQIKRFRVLLGENTTSNQIRSLLRAEATKGQTEYELNHIIQFIERIKQRAG